MISRRHPRPERKEGPWAPGPAGSLGPAGALGALAIRAVSVVSTLALLALVSRRASPAQLAASILALGLGNLVGALGVAGDERLIVHRAVAKVQDGPGAIDLILRGAGVAVITGLALSLLPEQGASPWLRIPPLGLALFGMARTCSVVRAELLRARARPLLGALLESMDSTIGGVIAISLPGPAEDLVLRLLIGMSAGPLLATLVGVIHSNVQSGLESPRPRISNILAIRQGPMMLAVGVVVLSNVDLWVFATIAPPEAVADYSVALRAVVPLSMPLTAFNGFFALGMAESINAQGGALGGPGQLARRIGRSATALSVAMWLALASPLGEIAFVAAFGEEHRGARSLALVLGLAHLASAFFGPAGLTLTMGGHVIRLGRLVMGGALLQGAVVALLSVMGASAMAVALGAIVAISLTQWRIAHASMHLQSIRTTIVGGL